MADNKDFFDSWEKMQNLQIKLLRNVYLNQRVLSTFMCEIWAAYYKKPYPEAVHRYHELFKHIQGQLGDHLFAEFGKIDLSDIFPDDSAVK